MEVENLSGNALLSETKRLYKENIHLKNDLSDLWNSIKLLITKVSHEFKTPLNSIIGFSELLKSKTTDDKNIEYINNILTSSNYMMELVQNIIDVTKSQYKPLDLSYSIFNSKEVIETIIDCFNLKTINYTLIDKTICADYTRFKQLVYNLISNAVKYSRQDMPIEIITYMEDSFFCFEIKDYGEGISEKNIDKIFDFFTQVSDDLYKKQRGSGIGLSLCKVICEAHKGNIAVKSKKEKGSVFTFKIPIDKPNN